LTQDQFKEIFDAHFEGVRNYIWYRSGDTELATDVAQETFLKVWEKKPGIRDGKIKGLLFKIAGDIFISHYRKEKTALNFKLNIKPDISEQSPEEEMQFAELNTKYDQALKAMPEKQRVVFLMSRIEELKYHEIAGNLNLSVKAVEKRMKHALAFLRKELNE
jgi:RNA polymerase sigma-70 factor (ECF subfamily)